MRSPTSPRRRFELAMILAGLAASAAARGDELRNVKVGQPVPAFETATLGGEKLRSADLRGKVLALVYVSAEQQSSERALQIADGLARELRDPRLVVAFMTADVTRVAFFRTQRDRLNVHRPLGLDVDRRVYGELGLIVLPTTIVVDGEGRLAHVISSCKSDYEHVLRSYLRHALGQIDDAELERALTTRTYERDRPEDRVARHRAAARLLREKGLVRDAENELRAALEIDADHHDTRLDLASLYVDTERYDEAAGIVEAVRRADPDHRRGKLLQGIVLYHRNRLDEAASLLEEVLLLNPDPVRTHYYLGLIAERRGDEAAAIRHFKESLRRLLREHPG